MLARRASHSLPAALMVVALTNPVREAWAQSSVKACTNLAEDGQRLRAAGKLIEAREKLMACSATECPQVVRADCAQWASEVLAATPTIVIDTKDGTGNDFADARVFVDDKRVADRIDGRPISVDPGTRIIRVERSDGLKGTQKIIAKENAKAREVKFVFGGTTTDPAEAPPAPVDRSEGASGGGDLRWPHYTGIAMVAVGVVAITYGVVSFVSYSSEERALRDKFDDAEQAAAAACTQSAPSAACSVNTATRENLRFEYDQNERDAKSGKTLWLGAAVGGLLLAGGGVALFFLSPRAKSSAPVRGAPMITPQLAGMTIAGSF